jgi:hypothetical protein
MSPKLRLVANAIYLTAPLWAFVLFIVLFCRFSGGGLDTIPALVVGISIPFVGAVPIYQVRAHVIGKAIVFLIYYVNCAAVMFIVGWAVAGTSCGNN